MRLHQRLRGPQYDSLRPALVVWINRVVLRWPMPSQAIAEVNRLQAIDTVLAETVGNWPRQRKEDGSREGHLDGRLRGRLEDESTLIRSRCATLRWLHMVSFPCSSRPLCTERRTISLLNASAFGHGGSVPACAPVDAECDQRLAQPQERAGRNRCSDRTDPENHHRGSRLSPWEVAAAACRRGASAGQYLGTFVAADSKVLQLQTIHHDPRHPGHPIAE